MQLYFLFFQFVTFLAAETITFNLADTARLHSYVSLELSDGTEKCTFMGTASKARSLGTLCTVPNASSKGNINVRWYTGSLACNIDDCLSGKINGLEPGTWTREVSQQTRTARTNCSNGKGTITVTATRDDKEVIQGTAEYTCVDSGAGSLQMSLLALLVLLVNL